MAGAADAVGLAEAAGDPWGEEEEWGVCWDFERKSWGSQWGGGGWKSSSSGPAQVPHWAAYAEPGVEDAGNFRGMPYVQFSAPGAPPPPPPPPGPPAGGPGFANAGVPPGSMPPWMSQPYGFQMAMPPGPPGQGFTPPADGPYVGDVAKAMLSMAKGKKGGKGVPPPAPEGPFVGDVAPKGGGYGWKGSSWKGAYSRGAGRGSWKGGWEGGWEEGAASEGKGGWREGGWKEKSWGSSWAEVEVGPEAEEWAGGCEDQPPGLHGRGAGKAAAASRAVADRGGRGREERKWLPAESEAGAGRAREREGGAGAGKEGKEETLAQIEVALQEPGCILQRSDFDSRVRQFFLGLRASGGAEKVQDALEMIHSYTSQKSRSSVGNWPAYLLTLLKRFEPELAPRGRGRGKAGTGEAAAGRPAAPASSPEPVAGTAAALPAAAAPEGGEGREEAAPAAGGEEEEEEVAVQLPEGWEEGRRPLLDEIGGVLAALGGGRTPVCPFSSSPLDLRASLVVPLAGRLGAAAAEPARPLGLARHAVGLARARELADCPRAAAAVAAAGGLRELAELPEDASAFDAATAAAAGAARGQRGAAAVAGALMEELGLELMAEVLHGPRLSPARPLA